MKCQCQSHSSQSFLQSSPLKQSKASLKELDKNESQAQRFNQTLLMIMQMMFPKVFAALAVQSQEAAQRIASGQAPIPLDYRKRWTEQLTDAQKTDLVTALSIGWQQGGEFLRNNDPLTFTDEVLKPQENGDINLTPTMLDSVFIFLAMLSGMSSDTHASKIEKEYEKVNEKEVTNREKAALVLAVMEKSDKNQATLITQYTTVWTGNEGLKKRYMAQGVTYLVWYSMLDERVCERCNSLHGSIIEIGSPFWEAGDDRVIEGTEEILKGPHVTVEHPPLHARCRCVALPISAASL